MNRYGIMRVTEGWTQQELAERADLSRHTIMRLEAAADPRPTPKVAVGLARAFEISVDELLGRDERPVAA